MSGQRQDDKDEDLRPEFDGFRPDEEEGPEASFADPDRCEEEPDPGSEQIPEDGEFDCQAEIHDAFPVEEIPLGIHPDDGMPAPVDGNLADALGVPFTYETQLCIEDDRTWVELFYDDPLPKGRSSIVAKWEAYRPQSEPLFRAIKRAIRKRFSHDGHPHERRSWPRSEVIEVWGIKLAKTEDGYVPVRPIRPRCKHFKQQVFAGNFAGVGEGEYGSQTVHRLCSIRRSNGGALMALNNSAVYCCDFRDPPDLKSTAIQAAKDQKKLEERPDKLLVPLFGMPGDDREIE